MAAVALIKFTQGATVGAPGEALVGVAGSVTVNASNTTDIVQWIIELLYAPPGSALETLPGNPVILGQASSNTPSASFVPDIPGCYRIRLTVQDSLGAQDVDIRNFAIPLSNQGFIIAPYQRLPDPLPVSPGVPTGVTGVTGPGPKPDEMNFGGQPYGWAGNNVPTAKLMHRLVSEYDGATGGGAGPTGPEGPTGPAGSGPVILAPSTLADADVSVPGVAGSHAYYQIPAVTGARTYTLADGVGSTDGDRITILCVGPTTFPCAIASSSSPVGVPPIASVPYVASGFSMPTQHYEFARVSGSWIFLGGSGQSQPVPAGVLFAAGPISSTPIQVGTIVGYPIWNSGQKGLFNVSLEVNLTSGGDVSVFPILSDGSGVVTAYTAIVFPALPIGDNQLNASRLYTQSVPALPQGYFMSIEVSVSAGTMSVTSGVASINPNVKS